MLIDQTLNLFREDNERDNELSAGAAWALPDALEFALDGVYSTQANGSFLTTTFSHTFGLADDRLGLAPFINQSLDFGFASDVFDGENDLTAGIAGEWGRKSGSAFIAQITLSWAQGDVKRDSLGDESWFGIGLLREF